eukprot:scaffold30456_cov33-Prasinocladus_malaysianus.AAC.2
MDEWEGGWMDGWSVGQMDECTHTWTNEWRRKGVLDEWMDGYLTKYLAKTKNLQKLFTDRQNDRRSRWPCSLAPQPAGPPGPPRPRGAQSWPGSRSPAGPGAPGPPWHTLQCWPPRLARPRPRLRPNHCCHHCAMTCH